MAIASTMPTRIETRLKMRRFISPLSAPLCTYPRNLDPTGQSLSRRVGGLAQLAQLALPIFAPRQQGTDLPAPDPGAAARRGAAIDLAQDAGRHQPVDHPVGIAGIDRLGERISTDVLARHDGAAGMLHPACDPAHPLLEH